ncbi:LysR family transcriptional regulator [Gordonia sp. VNQ95]|uniref:LysR family transcriptional regulator n=1 Tax=Gordonia sp. VNQ95 TaxID=3156619 RepID=UPI0032B444D3
MELRQLEYFVAVAQSGSFTRAAELTHTSQPNVSAQIRGLEREWGTALFERVGRTVTLSDAGAAALPHARAALDSAAAAATAVADVGQVIAGSLSVGMVDGCTIGALFDAFAGFRRAHPGVRFSLCEDESPALADRVRTADLDVALTGLAGTTPADLACQVIIAEHIVAVVPRGHHLAGRARLTPTDLAAETLVGLPRGAGIRTVFDRGCPDLRIDVEASSPDAILALVRNGVGVGILSESIAAGATDTIRGLRIRGVDEQALLALLWRRSPSPAVAAFVTRARTAFGVDRVTR